MCSPYPSLALPREKIIKPKEWTKRFEQLRMFESEVGYRNKPQRNETNQALRSWVNVLGMKYNLLKQVRKSVMTSD